MDIVKLPKSQIDSAKSSNGDDKNLKIEERLGVCIKNLERVVLYQNKICTQKCGELVGQKCTKGCMEHYDQSISPLSEGMKLVRTQSNPNEQVDAVVINDGETLTTLLYPLEKQKKTSLDYLRSRGLTKTELVVMEQVMRGLSNQEISEKLCVSMATLKSHLNRIYRKLPPEIKKMRQGV